MILNDNPQVGQARIASANSYRAAGDFPQAIKELREGLKYQDNDNQILALLGDTLSMMGRYREAAAIFESCVTINPENPANYNNLGLAYWNNGEVAKAEAAYQKALQQDNQFALTHANLGLLYLIALRDYRRARESLLTAVALDPNLASAHDALGGYYAKTGAVRQSQGALAALSGNRTDELRCLLQPVYALQQKNAEPPGSAGLLRTHPARLLPQTPRSGTARHRRDSQKPQLSRSERPVPQAIELQFFNNCSMELSMGTVKENEHRRNKQQTKRLSRNKPAV